MKLNLFDILLYVAFLTTKFSRSTVVHSYVHLKSLVRSQLGYKQSFIPFTPKGSTMHSYIRTDVVIEQTT